MALNPIDAKHALQIQSGTEGRKAGHKFELSLANEINNFNGEINIGQKVNNLFRGKAPRALIIKALEFFGWNSAEKIEAIALGALATAEDGKKWLKVQGVEVRACKSDILITAYKGQQVKNVGVSVKQCNNRTPTNAQLYFTTATAFINLLKNNGILVSEHGLLALKQFCGDFGFRPIDDKSIINRRTDPRRFFWEEINQKGKRELEKIFIDYQDKITRLLLQKAYLNDPFIPELLLHKTKKKEEGLKQEYALYSMDELIYLSKLYAGFYKKNYSVRKGSYKDPEGVEHEAPRFGIVQMQRGGQTQHPTQLQFNLQAGYFYHI
jgi:hypothetical protein